MVRSAIHLLVPRTAYTRLLERCNRTTPIYEHLVNGVIEKDDAGQERVRIFCDEACETAIREYIKQTQPELIFLIHRVVYTDGPKEYGRLIA